MHKFIAEGDGEVNPPAQGNARRTFFSGLEQFKERARELEEKFMEPTGRSIEELFPQEFQTDEFLKLLKTIERSADVPIRLLC